MFDELPAWVTSYLPVATSGTLPKLAWNTGPSFSSNDVFSVLGEWHQLPVTVTALRIRWAPTRGWETTRGEIEKYDVAVGEFWLGKLPTLCVFKGMEDGKGPDLGDAKMTVRSSVVETALGEPFETVAWKSFARFRLCKPSSDRNLALLSRRMVVDVMQLLDAVPEATVKLFQDGMMCVFATWYMRGPKFSTLWKINDEHDESFGWTTADLMAPHFSRDIQRFRVSCCSVYRLYVCVVLASATIEEADSCGCRGPFMDPLNKQILVKHQQLIVTCNSHYVDWENSWF